MARGGEKIEKREQNDDVAVEEDIVLVENEEEEKRKKGFECGICLELMGWEKEPKILPCCGFSFCILCLHKLEKKRKKRRDIGLGDASGEEPPRSSEGGAWNKSSGSLAVPGPQPLPTNKKQKSSGAVLSSHKTKSIAATVYCERRGSTTREDLRECSECQSFYCGACSELPPVQNPCLRVGLAHSFSDQPMSLAYSFSSFAEEIEAGSVFGSSSLFQGGSRGGGISLADSGGSRPSFSRAKPGELCMGSSSPQDILWKSSKRTMSDEDPHLLSSQSFNSLLFFFFFFVFKFSPVNQVFSPLFSSFFSLLSLL